jgi:hypothetical protein
MECEHTVLSLNPNGTALERYELELRECGFVVISFSTPIQLRFEIEMGRCGVLLISYMTPLSSVMSLVLLFRRSCPGGKVVYVSQHPSPIIEGVDVLLLDEEQSPKGIAEKIQAA